MTLSAKTIKTVYDARQNNPNLAEALDEISDVLLGVIGVTDSAAHNMDRPLNNTGEGQAINAVLDSVSLAHMALEAVYEAVAM